MTRFTAILAVVGATYVVLIAALLVADLEFLLAPPPGGDGILADPLAALRRAARLFADVFGREEIRYAVKLSLFSCTAATILSLWVAVPLGYLLSRKRFSARRSSRRSSTSPSCCRRLSSASAC